MSNKTEIMLGPSAAKEGIHMIARYEDGKVEILLIESDNARFLSIPTIERYTSRISELEAENQQLEIKVLDMQDDRSKLREAEHFIDLQKLTLRDLEAENKRLREALIDAKEDAAALIEQHRWIPVTERLPEENIYVLALAKARSIQEPGYNMQVIHSSAIAFGLFSHWQPLPQPPKEQ